MTLQAERLRSMEQVRAFVEGSEAVNGKPRDRAADEAGRDAAEHGVRGGALTISLDIAGPARRSFAWVPRAGRDAPLHQLLR